MEVTKEIKWTKNIIKIISIEYYIHILELDTKFRI
jgi:hypothetical protein